MEMSTEETQQQESLDIDQESFVEAALQFPCFSDAKQIDKSTSEVFDAIMGAYRDDNLTEEQDLVVELLFHMQHEDTPFNLNRAVALWSSEDLAVLWDLLMSKDDAEDELSEPL